ncbi:hypothetical protein CEXT_104671 [Caerostris extrusa]|uniref:Secreted protein n=1 Tax=Caerostris extrusa TaxID=172846 RepID=A0AAV4MJF3_CAEEX|nr:hypothetical protein CEXT_104671 [Caerostris extrusa]
MSHKFDCTLRRINASQLILKGFFLITIAVKGTVNAPMINCSRVELCHHALWWLGSKALQNMHSCLWNCVTRCDYTHCEMVSE